MASKNINIIPEESKLEYQFQNHWKYFTNRRFYFDKKSTEVLFSIFIVSRNDSIFRSLVFYMENLYHQSIKVEDDFKEDEEYIYLNVKTLQNNLCKPVGGRPYL